MSGEESILSLPTRPFWRVLGLSWERFSGILTIFFEDGCRNRFFFASKMILHRFWTVPGKEKWAFSMEGSAKIDLALYLLSNVFANRFREGFGSKLEAVLGSNCISGATSMTDFMMYAYGKGPVRNENRPLNFQFFGPQEEGSGRREKQPNTPSYP